MNSDNRRNTRSDTRSDTRSERSSSGNGGNGGNNARPRTRRVKRDYDPAQEFIDRKTGIAVIITKSREEVPRFTQKTGRFQLNHDGSLGAFNEHITAGVDRNAERGIYSGELDTQYLDIQHDLMEDALEWMQKEMQSICHSALARKEAREAIEQERREVRETACETADDEQAETETVVVTATAPSMDVVELMG